MLLSHPSFGWPFPEDLLQLLWQPARLTRLTTLLSLHLPVHSVAVGRTSFSIPCQDLCFHSIYTYSLGLFRIPWSMVASDVLAKGVANHAFLAPAFSLGNTFKSFNIIFDHWSISRVHSRPILCLPFPESLRSSLISLAQARQQLLDLNSVLQQTRSFLEPCFFKALPRPSSTS